MLVLKMTVLQSYPTLENYQITFQNYLQYALQNIHNVGLYMGSSSFCFLKNLSQSITKSLRFVIINTKVGYMKLCHAVNHIFSI